MGVQYYSTLFSYKACRLVVHAIINMSTCVIPQNMCLGFAWTTTCKALYYLKNTECLCCGNRLFIVLWLQFNQIINWNCNGRFTQTISHSSEVWYNKIGFLYYFLFEVGLSAMYFSYPKSVTKTQILPFNCALNLASSTASSTSSTPITRLTGKVYGREQQNKGKHAPL